MFPWRRQQQRFRRQLPCWSKLAFQLSRLLIRLSLRWSRLGRGPTSASRALICTSVRSSTCCVLRSSTTIWAKYVACCRISQTAPMHSQNASTSTATDLPISFATISPTYSQGVHKQTSATQCSSLIMKPFIRRVYRKRPLSTRNAASAMPPWQKTTSFCANSTVYSAFVAKDCRTFPSCGVCLSLDIRLLRNVSFSNADS
mmetsp:Transcript_44166/g.103260  ORF Transcript_44166/g.103260 Transcript_44166/m.103260 type:complete len:201 (+) Transcript_44166:95-697(+)